MHKKTGFFFSVWNLINDIISPGNVAMAQYVAQSGLLLSIGLISIFSVITAYTLCILYNLARMTNEKSLPDLCGRAFGRPGHIITCIIIFSFNFGGLCAQFLMFAEVVPGLLQHLWGADHVLISRTAILIYLTILFFPFAFMRELSSFSIISFLTVFSILCIAVIIFYETLVKGGFDPPPPDAFALFHTEALSALGGFSYIVCFLMILLTWTVCLP
jgi:sodium-coupled neutral amino acid transporter 11